MPMYTRQRTAGRHQSKTMFSTHTRTQIKTCSVNNFQKKKQAHSFQKAGLQLQVKQLDTTINDE